MKTDAREGVILVTVLWTVALLATVAVAASLTFRGFAGITAVERDRTRAEHLLTAGLEVAGGLVSSAGTTPIAGVESTVTMASGSVRLHLEDEGGRIDIAQASPELLAALFRSIGASDPEGVAREIVNWRRDGNPSPSPDPQTRRGPNPAPAPKQPVAPPFSDVHQLLQVPGMRPEWVIAVAPLTTVFGNATVNPLTAPAAVLAVLPGVNPARLATFLDARRGADPTNAAKLIGLLGGGQGMLEVKPTHAVAATLSARLADGYVAAADAVIVSLKGDPQPYRVLRWTPIPRQPGL
jgi:general secretion pathway protein K